jgi:hypothetical protein
MNQHPRWSGLLRELGKLTQIESRPEAFAVIREIRVKKDPGSGLHCGVECTDN